LLDLSTEKLGRIRSEEISLIFPDALSASTRSALFLVHREIDDDEAEALLPAAERAFDL
jgi:hypothetical protein